MMLKTRFAKKVDFIHANSVMYIVLKKNYQAKLVAGEKRGPEGKNTIGTIIVKNESSIKKISDLKDKKFIFGPEFAPAGFLAVYDLMKKMVLILKRIWLFMQFRRVLLNMKRFFMPFFIRPLMPARLLWRILGRQ